MPKCSISLMVSVRIMCRTVIESRPAKAHSVGKRPRTDMMLRNPGLSNGRIGRQARSLRCRVLQYRRCRCGQFEPDIRIWVSVVVSRADTTRCPSAIESVRFVQYEKLMVSPYAHPSADSCLNSQYNHIRLPLQSPHNEHCGGNGRRGYICVVA